MQMKDVAVSIPICERLVGWLYRQMLGSVWDASPRWPFLLRLLIPGLEHTCATNPFHHTLLTPTALRTLGVSRRLLINFINLCPWI